MPAKETGGSDSLAEKIRAYMEKENMAPRGSGILAGVSGGADSVCLLALLVRIREEMDWRIGAVHVNHGLREEAGEDAAFVRALCAAWDVPFFLKEEDVGKKAEEWRLSVEEAGRRVRYQAFSEAAERFGAERIAVAHNRNDRAETLLFHLFRGTGLKGMGSIRPVRGSVIRPLLDTGRDEIEAWLVQNGISWRTDASNETDAYTRNRIRRRVLPYAEEEICAQSGLHLAQAAELLAQTSDFVERQARARLEICLTFRRKDAAGLDVAAFRESEGLLQTQMIRLLLEELSEGGRDIGQRHILDVQALFERQSGRRLPLPGVLGARREFGQVILERRRAPAPETEKADAEMTAAGRAGAEQADAKISGAGRAGTVKADPGLETELFSRVGETGSAVLEIPGLFTLEMRLLDWEKSHGIEQKTYTKWLDYDRMESLVLRTRRPGDYLAINDSLQKKSLKEYLIQERVPADERDALPLLADGCHIVWVIGHRISSAVRVTESTKRVLRIHIRGGKENGGESTSASDGGRGGCAHPADRGTDQ